MWKLFIFVHIDFLNKKLDCFNFCFQAFQTTISFFILDPLSVTMNPMRESFIESKLNLFKASRVALKQTSEVCGYGTCSTLGK